MFMQIGGIPNSTFLRFISLHKLCFKLYLLEHPFGSVLSKFLFLNMKESWVKLPTCSACMSRYMTGAYLRLYLENHRETKFRGKNVKP